ncbi:DUF6678 family protein [Agarivorans albus]|uniref:DUF6678 family protein n=1 Tax=Agarivorans albus TaxID=182262 RepID=UPI00058E8988|nr:DUF6678 family protein [Agarivorans albus]
MLNHNSKFQIINFIEQHKLNGVMNNTKWNKLFHDLNEVDELISFKVTYIDGTTWPEPEATFPFTSELAQIWGNFLALEFIDINAKISHSRGALLNDEVVDHIGKIIQICIDNSAKFSITEEGVRIYGYLRHSDSVQLYNYT